jgi:hypothetical protein
MADGKPFLGMGDIMDQQLESADGRMIGRVADIEVEWRKDGSLVLTHLLLGPEALVGRVAEYMRPLAHRLLSGRFERRIPFSEVEDLATTIRLRGTAEMYREQYGIGCSERWLASHVLRFIPGSGYS